MRYSSALTLLAFGSALPAVVLGATQTVMVGMGAQLVYSPSNITAAVGDTINFLFMALGKNHSATQSSFADPCVPLASGADSGLNADYEDTQSLPVPTNASFSNETAPTWSITVNTTTPLWFHCAQTNPKSHCEAGMVFSINATPQKSFEAFLANAMNSSSAAAPVPTVAGSNSTTPAGSENASSGGPGSSSGSTSSAEENQAPSTSGSIRIATATSKAALGLLAIVGTVCVTVL